jgi:hypothetical protein
MIPDLIPKWLTEYLMKVRLIGDLCVVDAVVVIPSTLLIGENCNYK